MNSISWALKILKCNCFQCRLSLAIVLLNSWFRSSRSKIYEKNDVKCLLQVLPWVRSLVSEVRSHILQLSLHASATGPAHSRATTPQWEKSTHHNKDPAQPSSPKKGTSKQQISILFIIWFQTSYLTILCISFSICRINIITASTLSRCYEHWMN